MAQSVPSNKTPETGEPVVEELKRFERLFFALMVDPKKNQRERIEMLSGIGFNAREIADILGTTADSVGAQMRRTRRQG